MAKLVSKTYGEALFNLAVEEQTLTSIAEEAEAVLEVFAANQELMKLLNHPKIVKEEKISVVENIFKGRVSDTIVGFLVLIVEKGRYNDMDAIFSYFLEQVREFHHIGVAYVTSAIPLTEQQKEAIQNRLLATTSYIQFKMNYEVDQSLIGGLVIRIGDRVIDSSIRSKINTIAKSLHQIQI